MKRNFFLFILHVLVNIEFQYSFHSLLRVLFTFPSRYLFTIDYRSILRLRGWSPYLQESLRTPYSYQNKAHLYRALTSFCKTFQTFLIVRLALSLRSRLLITFFRVRSPLLTESLLIFFPSGTKMFQFPEFLL